ncbi:MAG: rRNA maturation RNase YbeY [Lachnospiraceae bacterium]|nr:rRNA maturation RNase YbeY [Lachnospiraceae bacterium]
MNIQIEKETELDLGLDYENIINEIVNEALDYMDCPYEIELNIILSDNEGIHQVNLEQREIDAPTDVLSFPMLEYEKAGDFSFLEQEEEIYNFNADTGELMLGDIMISLEKVREQAKEYNHSESRELAFLVAHSMLHLFGFDHMEEIERIEMERMQEEILRNKNYRRD